MRPLQAFLVLLVLLAAPLVSAAPAASGVVKLPIVSLHKYPSATSECVTQAFLGEPATVVARKPGWLKVTLPQQAGYAGWIPASAVEPGVLPKTERRAQVKVARAPLRSAPSPTAGAIATAYFATSLPVTDGAVLEAWIPVILPGGKEAFVNQKHVAVVDTAAQQPPPTGDAVIGLARLYMGVPYVWGGMSTIGVDCSGFTHTVYRFGGIRIHRDADQQFAYDGVPVARKDLEAGDLVFFYTYLHDVPSHVGFYIGNGKFIHASSKLKGVRISNLSEPYFQSRYAGARRILRQ